MAEQKYLSYSASAILQAVANGYKYGFDIMDITGLPSGTVYPALRRLEEREQRPTRKYYQLTPDGKGALSEAVKRYRLLEHLAPSARKTRPARERG
jgi:DNA-binding PadR family transcriptional regulator